MSEAWKKFDPEHLRMIINTRVGIMDLHYEALTDPHGIYKLHDVKRAIRDDQRQWLADEPATYKKAVWAEGVRASYYEYYKKQAKKVA